VPAEMVRAGGVRGKVPQYVMATTLADPAYGRNRFTGPHF